MGRLADVEKCINEVEGYFKERGIPHLFGVVVLEEFYNNVREIFGYDKITIDHKPNQNWKERANE